MERRSYFIVVATAAVLAVTPAGPASAQVRGGNGFDLPPVVPREAHLSPQARPPDGFHRDMTTQELVKKVVPSVARVFVRGTEIIEVEEGKITERLLGSTGTGFIIDPRGYLVTNAHVVLPDSGKWKADPRVVITFPKHRISYRAKVVGVDPKSDLAVLRADTAPYLDSGAFNHLGDGDLLVPRDDDGNWIALPWAKAIETGEDVVAIGYGQALGGDPSVTKGVVSAKRRSVPGGEFSGLIQTDAVINHGNSGGPLLNMRGEVVGVNTYSFPSQGTLSTGKDAPPNLKLDVVQGIFFARGAGTAAPFVEMLIREGAVRRAVLGVAVETVPDAPGLLGEEKDFDVGAIVTEVAEDSPAKAAGLRRGDVIRSLSYKARDDSRRHVIENIGDLYNALGLVPPGGEVELLVKRPPPQILEAYEEGRQPTAEEREESLTGQLDYLTFKVRTR